MAAAVREAAPENDDTTTNDSSQVEGGLRLLWVLLWVSLHREAEPPSQATAAPITMASATVEGSVLADCCNVLGVRLNTCARSQRGSESVDEMHMIVHRK